MASFSRMRSLEPHRGTILSAAEQEGFESMDRDEIEAAVSLLLDDMEGEWGDRHEIFLRIQQTLEQMRAMGMPLPGDLVRMEEELAAEFAEDVKNA